MKKIIALLLVVVMAAFSLASCAELTAAEMVADANKALEGGRYKATAKISVDCRNDKYSEAINQIFAAGLDDMEFYFDGKNFQTAISMEMMGFSISMDMSVVGNTVYYAMGDVKMKATATPEQIEEVIESMNSTDEMLDTSDFSEMTKVEKDGKTYITCTAYDTEKLNELIEDAEDMYESLSATDVSVDNVKLIATIKDGKYEELAMSMLYSFKIGNETIEIAMTVGMTFDFDAGKEITAPADADSYQSVSFDELGIAG